MANNKAIIIFSRLPIGNETKTRLSPVLKEFQRKELHIAMWKDIFSEISNLKDFSDIFLYWTGNGNINDYSHLIPDCFIPKRQFGHNLGVKMLNAFKDIFSINYSKAVIIGSDIPSVKDFNILNAFNALEYSDVVLGPSLDGGYWLIGMSDFFPDVFNIASWGFSNVLQNTVRLLKDLNLNYSFCDSLQDIDTKDDIDSFLLNPSNTYTFKFLNSIL